MADLQDCNFGDRLHMVNTDVVSDKWLPRQTFLSVCSLQHDLWLIIHGNIAMQIQSLFRHTTAVDSLKE